MISTISSRRYTASALLLSAVIALAFLFPRELTIDAGDIHDTEEATPHASTTLDQHPPEEAMIHRRPQHTPASMAVIKVVDSRGLPIPGALLTETGDNRILSQCDIHGVSTLPLNPDKAQQPVLVRKAGFVDTVASPSATQAVVVTMQDAHSLRVTCKHRDGSIAPDISCHLERQQDAAAAAWRSKPQSSGIDGSMLFDGLLSGNYAIAVDHTSLVALAYQGTTKNGVAAIPLVSEATVTLSSLSAVCVEVAGDEVISGFFRVGFAPALAAPGAGEKAKAAELVTKKQHPDSLTRVWMASQPNQQVEWVGYLRYSGWTSFLVSPRPWSDSLAPEIHVARPGTTDLTASLSVDWGGHPGIPLVARLHDTSHGIITFELRESSLRVPFGSYSVIPAEPSLRRYLHIEPAAPINLNRTGASWIVQASLREPVAAVNCFPMYQPSPTQQAEPLVGTIEVFDGDETIGQHYSDGTGPLRIWLPTSKELTWKCALQGAGGARVLTARHSITSASGDTLTVVLR
jgi:hypothetical protein